MPIMRQSASDVRIGQPYPVYRDLGLDWLARVPEHWEVRRLRTLSRDSITNGIGESAQPFRPDWPRYVRITDIAGPTSLRDSTSASLPPERAAGAMLAHGDLVFAAVGATYGKSFLYLDESESACFAGYLVRLRPKPGVSPAFLSYWAQARPYWEQVHRFVIQATIQNLSASRYKRIVVGLPPLSEQRAIARFLDHADRRIQRYKRAKERLIELLEEQKRALIHEAVTGRIDVRTGHPHHAYKDSGVERLGKVPESWEVRRIANIADLRVSNVDKHVREDEEPIRLCNYVDVYHNDRIRRDIAFMPATANEAEIQKFRMVLGDVLLTKDSEDWTDIGVPALVEYAAADLICGYHLAMLRPNDALVEPGYLLRALADSSVARQFRVAANGVTRYGLPRHAIRSVRIPLPSVVEQRAIVRFLDRTDRRIQRQISASRRQIALLQEYRTRLIADVVTGKLDVREAAADLPETDPLPVDDLNDGIDPESNLHPTEHDMAKEVYA